MSVNSGMTETSRSLDAATRSLSPFLTNRTNILTFKVSHHLAVAALAIGVLSGCSTNIREPYALTYENALQRYPGSENVPDSALKHFEAYFSHDAAGTGKRPGLHAADLYADDLYFSDTLLTSEDKAQVVRHLESMLDATRQLEVRVLDSRQTGADAYLVWQMTATFVPVSQPVTGYSIGVTHLRFNDAGQIVLHQDFWDASAGFYEHIPMLGTIIRTINGRFYE